MHRRRRAPARSRCACITVSTLKDAEQFFAAGFDDILCAVCIAPSKLAAARALRERGCRLAVVVDSMAAAAAIVANVAHGPAFEVLIEIDSDGHRTGVAPEADLLLEIARTLHDGGALLSGVMTRRRRHADVRLPDERRKPGARHRLAPRRRRRRRHRRTVPGRFAPAHPAQPRLRHGGAVLAVRRAGRRRQLADLAALQRLAGHTRVVVPPRSEATQPFKPATVYLSPSSRNASSCSRPAGSTRLLSTVKWLLSGTVSHTGTAVGPQTSRISRF